MTQLEALEILKKRKNIFLTGQPGSGKTYTINQYVEWCEGQNVNVAITASTGIAATHIGGTTIHSWSGIGIANTLDKKDIEEIVRKGWIFSRISRCDVLIIDEVSMINAETLMMVDKVCRAVNAHKENIPFGGIQVILVGDFFQLPPVQGSFTFEAPLWEQMDLTVCYLHEQHRQEDEMFLEILTAMRSGTLTAKHTALLKKRIVKSEHPVTRLFTHNGDVDVLNTTELKKIEGKPEVYGMTDDGGNPAVIAMLKKNCLSPEVLKLKKGALVMFTRNKFDQGYVNGTLGEIIRFENGLPVVRTNDGVMVVVDYADWSITENKKVIAMISQIPLRLAWAITVHKAQGMSLDSAAIDLSKAFEFGQGYVALSRVRSLAGLYLDGLNEKALLMHPTVVAKDVEFRSK